jgi:hypothetical protein
MSAISLSLSSYRNVSVDIESALQEADGSCDLLVTSRLPV